MLFRMPRVVLITVCLAAALYLYVGSVVFAAEPIHNGSPAGQKHSKAKAKSEAKHEADLEAKDVDLNQRAYMIEISRQIGVTCTHCHDVKDFKKDDKPAYKVSKTHIEMVKGLNEKYDGQIGQKVDCFMCHRGQAKWNYREKPSDAHSAH